MSLVPADHWAALRKHTPARIALGRAGDSLPTRAMLEFGLAHAQARDAVHHAWDAAGLGRSLQSAGFETLVVHSAAPDRGRYVLRPDLGARLDPDSRRHLIASRRSPPPDLLFVLADGLSPLAVERHGLPLLQAIRPYLGATQAGPIVIAEQARVALGDEIGELLGARQVVVVIGERPGLSAADSIGLYLTFNPRVGLSNADRNCISNVRPAGLDFATAAMKLLALVGGAIRLGRSGIDLKEEEPAGNLGTAARAGNVPAAGHGP